MNCEAGLRARLFFERAPAAQLQLGKPVSRFEGIVAFFRPQPGYPFRASETMNRVNALLAITVMAIMAGCAKKEAPPANPQADEDEDVAAAVQPAPVAAKPPPIVDRSMAAADMAALIDPAPQCQQYRDELAAKGQTPGLMDEMNDILVQAYKAGCGKKKQPKQ
jgi:hypothetical protein